MQKVHNEKYCSDIKYYLVKDHSKRSKDRDEKKKRQSLPLFLLFAHADCMYVVNICYMIVESVGKTGEKINYSHIYVTTFYAILLWEEGRFFYFIFIYLFFFFF